MLRFELVQQSETGRMQCAICLIACALEPVMVAVRAGDSEYVYLDGFLCPHCIYGGVEHVARELRNRAESWAPRHSMMLCHSPKSIGTFLGLRAQHRSARVSAPHALLSALSLRGATFTAPRS
jgi:hypothetical protein